MAEQERPVERDARSRSRRGRRKRRRRNIRIRVQFDAETVASLTMDGGVDFSVWDNSLEYPFPSDWTVDELADAIVELFQKMYMEAHEDGVAMRIEEIATPDNPKALPWNDYVDKHVDSGEAVVVKARGMSLSKIRTTLRFDLNDRVLCNCGPRWMSGHVVGKAVQTENSILPYLVKTDPLVGIPSKTVSVPRDDDRCCIQEVCFDELTQLSLIKASTPIVPESKRTKLRFVVGDKIACRVGNADDGLESWKLGEVTALWPQLPGERSWELGGVSGEYADVVPYKVELTDGKSIYCQADTHTLIRRLGMEPATRVKGNSKRMEVRHTSDGGREQVDHVTERRKRILESDSDDE